MKVIMVMFDSLNRRALPGYGNTWIHAPNFARLARRTTTFDTSYVCSMPCMPARRDLHTGRPNFLHRSWGPLEPFDDSMPRMLREAGITSHLISDHYHYWEAGGANYHTQYSTWQFYRGQEGDPWMGLLGELPVGNSHGQNAMPDPWHRQDRVNRFFMKHEEAQPQAKTFAAGVDFIRRNHAEDRWFLQIETFDPHEPFFSQRKYKDLYTKHYENYHGPHWDWPAYREVSESAELVEHMQYEYASLVSMCDSKLGDVLDLMDEYQMWDDTMLIVWTDHGFLLGEHECWAKLWMPWYQELANTPFFVWDPRAPGCAGQRRQSLVQPAIDLGPTLLDFFGMPLTPSMLGKPLGPVIKEDRAVRQAGIFGNFGGMLNVTDGRHVLMLSPQRDDNQPLYEYTLMPCHMRDTFPPREFEGMTLCAGFDFTKGCQVMKIHADYGQNNARRWGDRLYDIQADPQQTTTIDNPVVRQRLTQLAIKLMKACDAPDNQYERYGLKP